MNNKVLKRYSVLGTGVMLIMYLVGAIGFFLDPVYFGSLTPIHLLVVNLILVLPVFFRIKDTLVLLLVATLGFLMEALGVATGLVFGAYQYGSVLGIKLLKVPLIIGFNWAALLVAAYSLIALKVKNHIIGAALIGLVITGMDYLIEPVAIGNAYWFWEAGQIPIQNYLAWFVLSFLFGLILYSSGFRMVPLLLAVCFLGIQALFFIYMQLIA